MLRITNRKVRGERIVAKKTYDLAEALNDAQEWLDEVIGELEDAEKELVGNKGSEDIQELENTLDYALSQIQTALSRLR